MKEIIHFTDLQTEFALEIWRRPRQRHMNLTVRSDGSLRVTCNKRVAKRQILAFVEQSREFIARRSLEREAIKRRYPCKELISGEEWMFLGVRRPLSVIWTWVERIQVSVLENGELEMRAPLTSQRNDRLKAMREFYRRQGRLHLSECLGAWSMHMGVKPSALAIRGQSSRWGSCSSRRRISLNWKLMAAPVEVIDYVIIHELAHLLEMNHSKRFWNLVAQFYPEYKTALKWLKLNEAELSRQFHE